MDGEQFKSLVMDCAELGADIALKKLGLVKDQISQREAYRVFGEGNVAYWVRRCWIKRIKTGERNSKVSYPRIELQTVRRMVEDGILK